MKRIFNFIKNNLFLIFAAYWLINFAVGLITLKPSTLDDATGRIKALTLGVDLIWVVIFIIEHTLLKCIKCINKRIDVVEKQMDIIINVVENVVNLLKDEESDDEESDEEKKEETDEKEAD